MRTIIAAASLLAAVGLAAMAFASAPQHLGSVGYPVAWVAFALVGAVLAIRRAESPIGWLFLVVGVVGEGSILAGSGPVDPDGGLPSVLRLIAIQSWVVPYGVLAVLLILFPTGRPPTPLWWLPVAAAAIIIPLGILSASDDRGTSILGIIFGSAASRIASTDTVTVPGLLGLFFAAAASLFRRRRSASTVERQQLKWVGYAGALLATALVGTAVAFLFTPLRQLDPGADNPSTLFGGVPFLIGLGAVPFAVSIAILRYRLYDIDLLINRTLVYGALSALLAAAYVMGILLFQTLLRPITSGSEIAVTASTLAVIALFGPLRSRIQKGVDRRFYRRRYDAAATVDAFALRLRDSVDLDALTGELLSVVGDTVQPAHASVWLRERATR